MPWTRPILLSVLCVTALGFLPPTLRAEDRPADPLLRLAPPDAAVAVVIEDLRDHAAKFASSPLAGGLRNLPAYQTWQASGAYRQFRDACREIEAALGVGLDALRDDLLGDAVILVLHLGDDGDPEAAHGLLLSRVRDRTLLEKLIASVNANERQQGTLRKVADRSHAGVTYQVRQFAEGTKPEEYYAILEGNLFAWSNSESLILNVIDRQGQGGGLASQPHFQRVREAMPEDAVASLFLDPQRLQGLNEKPTEPARSGDDDLFEPLIHRYLKALNYVGVSLELRDGLVLHTHEAIDPEKLDEPLRRWASRSGDASALLRRLPPAPLLVAAGRIDFAALTDEVMSLLDGDQQAKAENLLTVLSGLLLGKDPRSEILPNLGPGVIAYLVRDESADAGDEGLRSRLALVVGMEIQGGSGITQAVENGLRTVLALTALDPKRAGAGLRVESLENDGIRLTVLRGSKILLAYYVEPGLLAVGTSAHAVSEFARGRAPDAAGSAFDRIRSHELAGSRTFLFADLDALTQLATAHREAIARKFAAKRDGDLATTLRDLDQVLALARLFRVGYATRAVDEGFTMVHHTIGLIARDRPPMP